MKRIIFALMVSGGIYCEAIAETKIQIFGVVDTGIIKESGSSAKMDGFVTSRIALIGSEDLGSGTEATFKLQQYFRVNDGTLPGSYSWVQTLRQSLGEDSKTVLTGSADVGLKGKWGHVRVGRVSNLSSDTFTLADPFDQNGIVTSFSVYNFLHSIFLSNTVRYDSPSFSGTTVGLTYTPGGDSHGNSRLAEFMREHGNDGFAVNVMHNTGQLLLLTNFERVTDSNRSFYWNAGGTYKWIDWKFFFGFEQSTFKSLGDFYTLRGNQKEWLTGLQYRTGPHIWSASYNRAELSRSIQDGFANKYALGYGYDLSKRTQLYANVLYVISSNDYIGSCYNSNLVARDSMTGVEFGIT